MRYIARELENKIKNVSEEYSCLMLTGARQTGKTTLLKKIAEKNRNYVTLDDLEERALAQSDPALFLQIHSMPLLIDEVQYAPQLFSYIKIEIDRGAPAGSFWLTGSQTFSMMSLARESLAGRVAVLHLPTLSAHEIYGTGSNPPFAIDLDGLKQRAQNGAAADANGIYQRIWLGSMPGLVSGKFTDREIFYSSYLQTYVERDIADLLKPSDKFLFADFLRSVACRTGQMINIHALAMDAGVSQDTAKRWLAVLEQSDILFLLRPYSNNLLKRTLKTPKLYFYDTGFVAWLTKHSSPDILQNGAINGAILENYAVAEITKSYMNNATTPLLWYYRDKDGKEIDLLIETDGELQPVEVKKSANPGKELLSAFNILDNCGKRGKGAIVCLREMLSAFDKDNFIVPVWEI